MPAGPPNSPRVPRHRYRSRRGAHQNATQSRTNLSSSSEPPGASDSSLALLPASLTPSNQQDPPTPSESSGMSGNGLRARGGRGGRSGRRGASGTQTITSGGRAFGGQLTRSEGPSAGSLQADAPEFRPGQPVQPRQ